MTLKDKKLDWEFISTWIYRIFIAGTIAGAFWGATTFVTHAEMQEVTKPLLSLPPRIESLEKMALERAESVKEYNIWRRLKDENDTKLANLADFQQKLLDRQQLMLDRQQNQIDDMNRRIK